ncbi:MAG TPA: hypothetical protein VMB21_08050, partial [Candidatus Limnocylindria bacterium]|nr:hypothetical protein [Candidatus Limnocylindria bacterium]
IDCQSFPPLHPPILAGTAAIGGGWIHEVERRPLRVAFQRGTGQSMPPAVNPFPAIARTKSNAELGINPPADPGAQITDG